jgi:hypothetical protein
MISRSSSQVAAGRRRTAPRSGVRTSARRDSDAFIVTVLTMAATIIALYDLLMLGVHVQG